MFSFPESFFILFLQCFLDLLVQVLDEAAVLVDRKQRDVTRWTDEMRAMQRTKG